MKIGLLTTAFKDKIFEELLSFARDNGFESLEIDLGIPGHYEYIAGLGEDNFNDNITKYRLSKPVFAYYENLLDQDLQVANRRIKQLYDIIDLAYGYKVPLVSILAGYPFDGRKNKEIIADVIPKVFAPILIYAKAKNVKISFEHFFQTVLKDWKDWELFFSVLPYDNAGITLDFSHLAWQGVRNYAPIISKYKDRIFHIHLKDVRFRDRLIWKIFARKNPFTFPGQGLSDWKGNLALLRKYCYEGMLSIENENKYIDKEKGFNDCRMFISCLLKECK